MKFSEVKLSDVAGKLFECTSAIEELEIELDPGMLVRFDIIKQDAFSDVVIRLELNTTGLANINDPLMKPNFYDKDGSPVLTAKEANRWPADDRHIVFVASEDNFEDYFVEKIEDKKSIKTTYRGYEIEIFETYAVAAGRKFNNAWGAHVYIDELLQP